MYTKSEVNFEHPAEGPDHCGMCVHFRPEDNRCSIVSGTILAQDWCERFKKGNTMKAKTGETPKFSHTFGSGLKQVAPNEHVKNGDTIVSSTSGKLHQVGHGAGTLKKREPNENCANCNCDDCPGCNGL